VIYKHNQLAILAETSQPVNHHSALWTANIATAVPEVLPIPARGGADLPLQSPHAYWQVRRKQKAPGETHQAPCKNHHTICWCET
jgi:hypothetical protein